MTQQALFQAPRTDWTTTLPDWLAENLDAINNQPAGTPIHLEECRRCHQPILTGIDCCVKWTLSSTTLNNQHELAATILGTRTFTITTNLFGFHALTWRTHRNITNRPASMTTVPNPLGGRPLQHLVVPEHKCGRTLGNPIEWDRLYKKPAITNNNPNPPF